MKRYNLIVVGGGLTGVAAAVAAAREGLEVLLIERTGSLGGAMSNSLVYPFMQYWDKDPANGKTRCLSAGIFTEMRRRQLEKAAGSPTDAFRSVSGGTVQAYPRTLPAETWSRSASNWSRNTSSWYWTTW